MADQAMPIPFKFGEKVIIDDDKSIEAVVVGYIWRMRAFEIEVSWFHGGTLYTSWVADFRVKAAR